MGTGLAKRPTIRQARSITIRLVAAMTESDAGQIWIAMREARVRSLYFGGMLSRYTRIKRCIQFVTLAFSAAAVMTAVREAWPEWTSAVAAVVAVANVWAISTSLDQKILTMATLRTSWEDLRIEYSALWSKWDDDGAMHRFEALQRRCERPRDARKQRNFLESKAGCLLGAIRGHGIDGGGLGMPGSDRIIKGSWPPIKPPRRKPPPPPRPPSPRPPPPRK